MAFIYKNQVLESTILHVGVVCTVCNRHLYLFIRRALTGWPQSYFTAAADGSFGRYQSHLMTCFYRKSLGSIPALEDLLYCPRVSGLIYKAP